MPTNKPVLMSDMKAFKLDMIDVVVKSINEALDPDPDPDPDPM